MTFEEIGLRPEVLEAITQLGFETPTPIQEKAIPFILESDRDLVALAQTGTGKTGAFGLPVISQLDLEIRQIDVKVLVLCPTRELCVQITSDLSLFAKYRKGLRIQSVYGGTSIVPQIKALKRGAHVVAGTPGRVHDLIKRGILDLSEVDVVALDEADEMLTMGFKDELDAILSHTPEDKRTLLFSATMPGSVAKRYVKNPEYITIGKKNASSENVTHEYYLTQARDKYEVLQRIVDINPEMFGIIFCRTRQDTKDIAEKLSENGYNVDALHGDLSQPQRDFVMNRFKKKQLQLLVATDVASRGLDVSDLTHVINYTLPDSNEVYIHRSGRTGRANNKGTSISIITKRDIQKISSLERTAKKTFERKQIPMGDAIVRTQLFSFLDKVQSNTVESEMANEILPSVYERFEDVSKEDLIKNFVSLQLNHFLDLYKDARDLNQKVSFNQDRDRGDRGDRGDRRDSDRGRGKGGKFARFFINIGGENSVTPRNLIAFINRQMPSSRFDIGKIDIQDQFSFFEVDRDSEEEVLTAFDSAKFDGKRVNVEKANPRGSKTRGQRGGGGGGGRRDRRSKFKSRDRDRDRDFSNKRSKRRRY